METIYRPVETELDDQSNRPEQEFGGFRIRLGASIVDSIWLVLLTFLLTILFWIYWAATPGKHFLGL